MFGTLFGSNDPEAEKRRALNQIAKQIGKTRFKFYRPSAHQVLPAFPKFFYDIYKVISPAQAIFANPQAVSSLKNCMVDYFLSDNQRECFERLEEESIVERAKQMSAKDLEKQVRGDFNTLKVGFDSNKVKAVDTLCTLFTAFQAFVTFDFFALLKKFDGTIHEREFSSPPDFQVIRDNHITEDIKDFIAVAWVLPLRADWQNVFAFIKEYKQVEPIAPNVWNKVLNRIGDLRTSKIFEMMLAYITENPSYAPDLKEKEEHIVDMYLDKMRARIEGLLQRIAREKANSKTEELVKNIFGTTDVYKLRNYAKQANEYFVKRALPMYTYCDPLNYTKAFLVDYFKKDGREVATLALVRGKWLDIDKSRAMSDVYNNLLALSDKITALDESLGETVDRGSKIKSLTTRAERDKAALSQLQASFKNVNGEVFNLLTQGARNFVMFGKFLKLLIEDLDKNAPELLSNWKEVQHAADAPLKPMFVAVYKKIYLFVQLMQVYLTENK